METIINWNSHLSFTSITRGHEVNLDTIFANGGLNRGPNPKEMLLNAIGTCAGMDIVSILESHKEKLLTFSIAVKAEMTKTTPSYFANIHLIFKCSGETHKEPLIKACELSMTKYCGVSYMLSKACPISYELHLNDENIFSGISKFN